MKDGKKTAVPKLRFPEFRNAGSWDQRTLSELLREQKQRNRDLKFGPGEVLSVSGDHGCVNQIELLGRSYAGVSVKEYHVVETGDLVYTKSPLKKNPYGIIKENKGKPGIVSTLYAVYRVTELGHPAYLDHYFSRDYNLNSYLQPIVRKGAKNDMKVNNAAVLTGEVLAPQMAEQKKIANCLTSLDELITAQSRKIEALKTYKRGLMQQLFPRKGATVPRLRFPEFRNGPEWDVQPLCKIAENLDNKRVPITESERTKGSVPYYGASGVVDYVKDYLFDEELLCVSEDGANLIARSYPIAFPITGKTWVNNHSHVLRFKNSATQKIVQDYLNFIDLQDFITGMAQPKLNRAMLDRIPVPLPDVDEGQKLAGFLFSIDSYLVGESNALDALRTHKNGLIQQLFPSLEEA
ncbi:restriction endonuclease subunit S [Aeromonas veronii]|uniref:restriction endonuclease subunit S n=1 Tax=Aeromonas veronii TaxID=654 RepID=UPI003D1E59ED